MRSVFRYSQGALRVAAVAILGSFVGSQVWPPARMPAERAHAPTLATTATTTAALTPPGDGKQRFGVQLSWDVGTPAAYVRRSGVRPAQYGEFVGYPLTQATKARLSSEATSIAAVGGDLFLTLEPWGGLSKVNAGNTRGLARTLQSINAQGPRVFVRFAHEMDGGWYPWGQRPAAYVKAFRMVAVAVHRYAPGNVMVWSPNYGGGYPFTGGAYVARPGTAEFAALDTDRNGTLTMSDDMYAPFYPGDTYVDWVGLTLYWYGIQWPWGENELPDHDRLPAQITGNYVAAEDERGVPNFYAAYAVEHSKPMALSETAALYNASRTDGASELDIKTAWMDQALSPANRSDFPKLQMVNWFELAKVEQENYGLIDWRATYNPDVLAALRRHLSASPGQFLFATAP
jgi:hypothetical protein